MIEEARQPGITISQMVWACFWPNLDGRPGRSKIIFMERRTGTKAGYTAQSYQNALENGHLPYCLPG